jgi:maleylacetoacetate isomerase
MKLYGYFRSSAAFRVRIALNLKKLDYESAFIHLRRGDQRQPGFLDVNPQGLVPALENDDALLIQSLPIIEYLDETYPSPPLLPRDAKDRARVRALAAIVACDIHPINNLRVLRYLLRPLGHDEATVETWYNHWIAEGFGALERLLAGDGRTGQFCHGDTPGLADVVLVPQVFNAHRYQSLDLAPYPTIVRIYETCLNIDAFAAAHPDRQPDREP